jgi:hypothetical protein
MTGHRRVSDPRGQVVLTRFECRGLLSLLLILALHHRVKREVRRVADGYLGHTTLVQWRSRTLLSFSLWDRLDSVYAMGESQRHITASRLPARLRATTSCGIYAYSGEWKQVMFGTPTAAREPLFAAGSALHADPQTDLHTDRRNHS